MFIKLIDVKKDYLSGKVVTPALRGVNLEIKRGEFVAIVGSSGSGKSTLMHIIGLLDKPTAGKYLLSNKDVSSLSDDQLAYLRNEKIGFVFQSFNLLPKISVLDNVLLPTLYSKETNHSKAKKEAISLLEKVGLKEKITVKPNEISGGEQQRVAIVRALINNPDLVLADEPTGNLDSKSSKVIMEIFSKIHQEGKTIIIVTHEDNIAKYAQRIVTMKDGKII